MKPVDIASCFMTDGMNTRPIFLAATPEHPFTAILFRNGVVCTEWELSEDERARLITGERVRVWIWNEGQRIQPFSVEVTDEER